MKKILFLFIATLLFSSLAHSQQKLLTIDDIFDPMKRVRFSGQPTFVEWASDGVSFKDFSKGILMRTNALTGQSQPFYDAKKLVSALSQVPGFTIEEANNLGQSPEQHFNSTETAILINSKNDLFIYNVADGKVTRLTNTDAAEELEEDFSPDGKTISFVRGWNLFVVDVATAKETQLTFDGTEKILNGYLPWVYEEELYGRGNKRGYWWSPDSTKISYLRTDSTPVKPFIVINHEGVNQEVETEWYPKAGQPNPSVKLGILNISEATKVSQVPGKDGITKFIDLSNYNADDVLIARVTWSPDSQSVIFQALNREQTFLDLSAANSKTGSVTKILTEKTPAYVEVYDNPTFLKNGNVVWQSARDGWRHLYLYDSTGKMLKQLTTGKWEIREFHGVDEKNGFAYFSGTKDSHIGVNAYRVKLDGSSIERITKGDGTHSVNFNSTFTHFVDYWSDANTPTQTRLFRSNGELEKVLGENKVSVLSQYKLGQTKFLKVKTRDGFEMEAQIILPPDFDPAKKYPVWSYTYSGPHLPSVANRWGGSQYMWFQMLAQKGYIVWICDNRSASGKGEEATWTSYKNLGVGELRDLEDGVTYLKSLPYVDGSRIGISGWSFGGFMTSYALTHSNSFKIGIAGGSVTDWRLYDSIYTERYMMTPQNNKEGYDRTSPTQAAKDLNGKLLLIHGVIDDNVHMQNTMQFVKALQLAGKQFDLMVYPENRHGIVNPQQNKHMRQMMTDFILKNL